MALVFLEGRVLCCTELFAITFYRNVPSQRVLSSCVIFYICTITFAVSVLMPLANVNRVVSCQALL